MARSRELWVLSLGLVGALLVPDRGWPQEHAPLTTIYFVRHGETEASPEGARLDARGEARAIDLVRTFSRVPLGFAFSSHTLRAQQIVAPTAKDHGLSVVRIPAIGSRIDGKVVDGAAPSNVAIVPLADALSRLPEGSIALVGVNSDNIFGILHRLGVPTSSASSPCVLGRSCVPCLDRSCFPEGEFDTLWVLRLRKGWAPELTWLKYGSR